MSETAYKSLKDLPAEHLLAPGTSMCAGCGGLPAVRLFHDVLGAGTVFVNAASCMTTISVYPQTPFQGSWIYTAMGSAPAGAQGVRDALDILVAKGGLAAEDAPPVVVLSGDGAATGIGLSATSGAIERGLDFYYLCYDNEGFGNTGYQSSAATPHGAATATEHRASGVPGEKKDLFGIWAAHRPAYVATVSDDEPMDFVRKLERAKGLRGPKLFIALAPCPTGWHFEPRETMHIARLAVKSGVWPLKEYVDGQVRHTKRPPAPDKRPPVEEYLRLQGRYAHLFRPQRNEAVLAEIQRRVDEYWAQVA